MTTKYFIVHQSRQAIGKPSYFLRFAQKLAAIWVSKSQARMFNTEDDAWTFLRGEFSKNLARSLTVESLTIGTETKFTKSDAIKAGIAEIESAMNWNLETSLQNNLLPIPVTSWNNIVHKLTALNDERNLAIQELSMNTKYIIENPIQFGKKVSGYFVKFAEGDVAIWTKQKTEAKRFVSEDSAHTFITGEFKTIVVNILRVEPIEAIDCVKV